MDLAKIRKKARLAQDAPPIEEKPASERLEIGKVPQQQENLRPVGSGACQAEYYSDEVISVAEPIQYAFLTHPARRDTSRSPLETILAGRVDAGCDTELQDDLQEQVTSAGTAFEEYLCVCVSDETYGINIMQIKEIITPRQVTEVPRAPSFVCGVISLRGVIIPVLDMNDRLGLNRTTSTGRERVVVVKSGSNAECLTGLYVDRVTHVARVPSNRIEAAPLSLDGIDRDYVRGIGHSDNHMLILLNIETVVDFHLS